MAGAAGQTSAQSGKYSALEEKNHIHIWELGWCIGTVFLPMIYFETTIGNRVMEAFRHPPGQLTFGHKLQLLIEIFHRTGMWWLMTGDSFKVSKPSRLSRFTYMKIGSQNDVIFYGNQPKFLNAREQMVQVALAPYWDFGPLMMIDFTFRMEG